MSKMSKVTIELEDNLLKGIKQYCSVNQLVLYKYINELLKKSFNIDRYGEFPGCLEPPEKEHTSTETITSTVSNKDIQKTEIETVTTTQIRKRKRSLN